MRRACTAVFETLLIFTLSGCCVLKTSVVNHAGPIAASEWRLYTIVGAVLVFVAAPVLILTPIIAWHYRISNKHHAFRPNWSFSWTLEALIWLPPSVIVIGLAVVLWSYTTRLDPYNPLALDQPPLEVQAVGFDWKWLFIYPEQHIAVFNQLPLPVGRPVHITLTSGAVMQALLIPQLAGQIYAMAGMATQLNLAASRPGTYLGENTQYNGDGFQDERFEVVALPSAAYDQWALHARGLDHPLDEAAYQDLFKKSSPAQPVLYSSIPQNLFANIIKRTGEPRR